MDRIHTIDRIREFNRFYTVQQDFLNGRYLNTDYSITELRILFEICQNSRITANFLVDILHMDKGYISRLISRLEKNGLVKRNRSETDNRAKDISLTDTGGAYVDKLVEAINVRIGKMIATLNASDCDRLCGALDVVTELLSIEDAGNEEI